MVDAGGRGKGLIASACPAAFPMEGILDSIRERGGYSSGRTKGGMLMQIRKLVVYAEELRREGGKEIVPPVMVTAAAAVIANPWAGMGYVEDLKPAIDDLAPRLGRILVDTLLETVGSGERVEAFGKSAIVGTAGEIEHAAAMIQTLEFGNLFRDAVGGTSVLSSTSTRAGPGATISIPMIHKTDSARRSHFITLAFSIHDAPASDEICVAIGASTGSRPHHRIGDRRTEVA